MTERLEAAEIRILTINRIARGDADLALAVVRRVDMHVHDVPARAPVEEREGAAAAAAVVPPEGDHAGRRHVLRVGQRVRRSVGRRLSAHRAPFANDDGLGGQPDPDLLGDGVLHAGVVGAASPGVVDDDLGQPTGRRPTGRLRQVDRGRRGRRRPGCVRLEGRGRERLVLPDVQAHAPARPSAQTVAAHDTHRRYVASDAVAGDRAQRLG